MLYLFSRLRSICGNDTHARMHTHTDYHNTLLAYKNDVRLGTFAATFYDIITALLLCHSAHAQVWHMVVIFCICLSVHLSVCSVYISKMAKAYCDVC